MTTNGRQYLVGYSYEISRFGSLYAYDHVLVQLVSPEGSKIGPPRGVNHSTYGELSAVATHWLVLYNNGEAAHVAFLDESLNVVVRLPLKNARFAALKEIGGRWWAFTDDSDSLDAIEIRPDGTAGAHFSTTSFFYPSGYNMHVTDGLLLIQKELDIVAQPFDPFTGFGTRRTFLAASRLIDVEPVDGGSMLLVASSDTRYDTIFIDAAGVSSPQLPLFEAPLYGYYALGSSKNGLLLFITQQDDLYAYRVPDVSAGQLISRKSVPDRRRGARH